MSVNPALTRCIFTGLALAIAIGGATMTAPAFADPPAGKKERAHGRGAEHGEGHGRGGGDSLSINLSFNDNDRMVIHDYYGDLGRNGHCPPGLAKKNNGCMPPGQAKKWMLGRPLPRDLTFYELPPDLIGRLSLPPQGYRYVRVAGDILMIAVGTGMVAAAIEDLAR